jgi:N-acetylmuramoyl-L-alanine amidase
VLGSASPAAAASHVVQPGESLWSVARADAVSPAALAATNGLSAGSPLIAGSVIQIPGPASAGESTAAGDNDGDSDDGVANGTERTGSTASSGSYVVRPGDTLSAIAARAGTTTAALASANALDPRAPLLAGSVIRLATGAPLRSPTATAAAAPVLTGAPIPTSVRVTGPQVGAIAAQNGVPPSLARAIAWQESGFNNGVVSSANARGVMQIVPSTWTWIQRNLALTPLDPASPADNIKAGSLLLRQLLRDAGGNEPLAIAGYYQGLDSVRRIGMLPDTRRYVANVLALQGR